MTDQTNPLPRCNTCKCELQGPPGEDSWVQYFNWQLLAIPSKTEIGRVTEVFNYCRPCHSLRGAARAMEVETRLECRGRVPTTTTPVPSGMDPGSIEATRLQSYCPDTEQITIRLDTLRALESWAEVKLSLPQLQTWLRDEGVELSWRSLETKQDDDDDEEEDEFIPTESVGPFSTIIAPEYQSQYLS